MTFETIKRWHLMARAFIDIGYHWLIERNGSVKQGRALDDWSAHAKGHNHQSFGISLVGGLNDDGQLDDNFAALQKRMLKFLATGYQGLSQDGVGLTGFE